jgi:hypothetical protein
MDVRQYFRKLREIEANIPEQYPLVMSLETSDGGKAGLITEVPRHNAARMIAEGRAVLANESEKESYRAQQAFAREIAERDELAKRLQVTVVTEADLRSQLAMKKNHGPSTTGK